MADTDKTQKCAKKTDNIDKLVFKYFENIEITHMREDKKGKTKLANKSSFGFKPDKTDLQHKLTFSF